MWKHLKIICQNDMNKEELNYNYLFDDNRNIPGVEFLKVEYEEPILNSIDK